MAPKNVFAAVIFAALLTGNAAFAAADQYRGDEFLGLDLSKAALSPKLLGPASGFTPVPAAAKPESGAAGAQARVEPKAKANTAVRKARVAHMRAPEPRIAARTRMARRHTNPLDAQALDTSIQVWPCKSGGICGWKRRGN